MSTNGPSNGSNAPDPNTVVGWSVQGSAAQTSLDLGTPSAGYAQTGITASTAALTSAGNGSPGVPNPLPGNVTDILANAGYGDVSPALIQHGTALASSLVPVPASNSAFTSPVALSCTVTVSGGTLTAVKVGAVQVGTGDGIYLVPGGGSITLTYTVVPTWAWVTN
jgi:hypothetical protein